MNNILVLDMSNVLYKTFYVHSRESDHDLIRKLAYNTSLTTLNKYLSYISLNKLSRFPRNPESEYNFKF